MTDNKMNNNKHYICTGGCMGVSKTKGTCQAKTCLKHAKQLVECNCKNNNHKF